MLVTNRQHADGTSVLCWSHIGANASHTLVIVHILLGPGVIIRCKNLALYILEIVCVFRMRH